MAIEVGSVGIVAIHDDPARTRELPWSSPGFSPFRDEVTIGIIDPDDRARRDVEAPHIVNRQGLRLPVELAFSDRPHRGASRIIDINLIWIDVGDVEITCRVSGQIIGIKRIRIVGSNAIERVQKRPIGRKLLDIPPIARSSPG